MQLFHSALGVASACLIVSTIPGCSGTTGDPALQPGVAPGVPAAQTPAGPTPVAEPAVPAPPPGSAVAGTCAAALEQPFTAARLRRLSVEEYFNTIGHALGMPLEADVAAFPQDPTFGGYLVKNSLTLSDEFVNSLGRESQKISTSVVQNGVYPGNCVDSADADACVMQGLPALMEKFFRAPVSEADVQRAYNVYLGAKAALDSQLGVETLLEYLMLSPRFLYHSEVGSPVDPAAPDVQRLTQFELASQLSYAIQGHGPDTELFELARAGGLTSPDAIAAQVRRLLATETGKQRMREFFHQWLKLSKPIELQPVFGDFPVTELEQEADRFFDFALSENLSLPEMISTKRAFMTPELQEHYELSETDLATQAHHRRGIFGLGAFLASHGKNSPLNPIFRGVFLSDRVFCRPIPPPPQNVNFEAVEVETDSDEVQSPKQILAAHRAEGTGCNNCHKFIDPLGFAFEEFDHLGRHREVYENGIVVDSSGTLEGTDVNGDFANFEEFIDQVASSDQVQRCFVSNYASFALAELNDNIDSCNSIAVHEQTAGDVKLADFITSFLSSNWFLHRSRSN